MGPGKRGINIEKQEERHETADYGGLVFKCKQKADNSGTVIMVSLPRLAKHGKNLQRCEFCP